MQNKRHEEPAQSEPKYNRRTAMAIGAASAAAAAVWYLWPDFTPEWLTTEPLPMQPSIDGRLPSNVLFAGKERQAISLDRAVEEAFLAQIKISKEDQRRWYEMGGSANTKLVHSNVRIQDCFIPEKRKDVAEGYKEYAKHAFREVYKALGRTDAPPLVFIARRSFVEAPRSAAVVSMPLKLYKADFEISDGTRSLKIPSEAMLRDEDTFGSNSFELDIVWGESVKFYEAPLILSFQGSMYERLQTPVAEILHGVIRPGTQALLHRYIANKWPEDKTVFAEITNECLFLEEAIAHAVAYVIIPSIASSYEISVNEKEREAKRTFEHGLPRFKYLSAVEKLLEPKDPLKLIRDYNTDPDAIREKLGVTIR